MRYVDFYKTQNDGTQLIVLRCWQEGEIIKFDREKSNIIKDLEMNGIKNYTTSNPLILFPNDGLLFLKNLQYNFKSGYLNASDIKE